jgi:hypothetical protein
LHKIVLQETRMTTENASRDRNTTKLELKTRLNTEIDFPGSPLCSPLFTSSTKLNLDPFFLNSWMFLVSSCTVSKIKACHTHIVVNMIARSFSLCKIECIHTWAKQRI